MNSLDFLHIALGAGALLLSVFLSVVLVFLILILKDFVAITKSLKSSSEKIEDYVMQPARVIQNVFEKVGFLSVLYNKISEHLGIEEDIEADVNSKRRKKK